MQSARSTIGAAVCTERAVARKVAEATVLQLGSTTEGRAVLKRTVRNYLAWTAFAVAGALLAMQAKSAHAVATQDVARIGTEASSRASQHGIDGVIEVENDLTIREGPRPFARADRDAGATNLDGSSGAGAG